MTSVFASRRRAEEFHSLVETATPGEPRDARLLEFLEIVETLRDVPAPEPRPDFVVALREELMTAADTLLVPAANERLALPVRSRSRDRRLAAAIGGFAVVGATTSMAVAAQSALPGDLLYPIKRVIEDAQVQVTTDRDAKALTLLDNASSRLEEVEELGRRGELSGDGDGAAVAANLRDFASQATEAADLLLEEYADTGDESLVRELRDFAADSIDILAMLEGRVPESARDELVAAARVVAEIDDRAQRACPTCGGAGVDQIPSVLLAAGVPADLRTVVVPGLTVENRPVTRTERRGDVDRQPEKGTTDGERRPDLPPDTALTPNDAVTAPEPSRPGPGGGGQTENPLQELGDALTGSGPATSGGKDPVEELEDVVEDAVDGVGESLGGVGETLDGATDGLGDPLGLD